MSNSTVKQPSSKQRAGVADLSVARRLGAEVARAVEGKTTFESVRALWERAFADFRSFEKEQLIEREGTRRQLKSHRDLMNLLIVGADTIANAMERQLAICFHLKSGEVLALEEQVALLRRHKEILSLEFDCWHGQKLTTEQIALATKVLCVEV